MTSKRPKDPGRVVRQVGALPIRTRADGRLEVLLVTSRETRRWVVPKGNRMKGLTGAEAAATEALEEAGVFGTIAAKPFDCFLYWKRRDTYFMLCEVDLYLLRVSGSLDAWKEQNERDVAWVPIEHAAELVVEPGLQAALRKLADAIDAGDPIGLEG